MCIVVDINTLAPVFSEGRVRNPDFFAIKEWINAGKWFSRIRRYEIQEGTRKKRYLRLIRPDEGCGACSSDPR